jgi:hypothetical protein
MEEEKNPISNEIRHQDKVQVIRETGYEGRKKRIKKLEIRSRYGMGSNVIIKRLDVCYCELGALDVIRK